MAKCIFCGLDAEWMNDSGECLCTHCYLAWIDGWIPYPPPSSSTGTDGEGGV